MGAIWLLPTAAFGALVVATLVMCRRLATELRATAEALTALADATAAVRADLARAGAAIDSLDVPSLREATVERAFGLAARWAARRVLRF